LPFICPSSFYFGLAEEARFAASDHFQLTHDLAAVDAILGAAQWLKSKPPRKPRAEIDLSDCGLSDPDDYLHRLTMNY
jgi:membrane-bound metal-dependent hydrolase YbcI (DUF457 family)